MVRLEGGIVVVVLACVTSCFAMQSVPDTIRNANQTEFVTVLEQALDQGLLDLSTGGPYTILVPTNDAFSRVPPEDLATLNVDSSALADVIKYHVIQGEVFSWDMDEGRILHTINGHSIRVYKSGQGIYLNSGHVVKTDLEANNAVIHLIDQVLDVPEGTIYGVLRNPEYPLTSFADLVDKIHLNRTFDSMNSKYTVFVPSNDAFSRLPSVVLDRIQSSYTYLRELVSYHTHQGTLHLQSLDRNGTISTMYNGHDLTVSVDTDVHLNRVAELEQADIDCDNGVVHIIDHVLIPASLGAIIG